MTLFKKLCVTSLLSMIHLAAFAQDPTTCPTLDTVIANADSMDTVSVVLGKMPPPRLSNKSNEAPYIVFSFIPIEAENTIWFPVTFSMSSSTNIDTILSAGADNIKMATMTKTDSPEELGPALICAYATPRDDSDMPSVLLVSFKGLTPDIATFVHSDLKTKLKEKNHKYAINIK